MLPCKTRMTRRVKSIGRHRVIDGVTTQKHHAVSVTYVVALHPDLRIIRKLPDAAIQLIEILVRLKLAPLLEGVSPDIDKIALS
jgi:hypothetical protein